MERNMELIRNILLKLESSENIEPNVEGYPEDLVRYNMAQIIEGGLAEGTVSNAVKNLSQAPSAVFLRKLTWNGHEFLDNVRKESVWSTIKQEFKDESLNTIVSVGKQLAEAAVKKKVNELLDENS